jgi:hypothetical protein
MKNVFIAVGGSGAKVAEALVKLLAMGFPTHRDASGLLTSAGDELQIWRVDPDRSAGAAIALQNAVKDYEKVQRCFSEAADEPYRASSRWAMDLDLRIRDLDPLQLPRADGADNVVKTLAGVLDSRYIGHLRSSLPLLAPFYDEDDLNVEIDRGFYQKPFIGAAVMAIFAESLRDQNSHGGRESGLTALHHNRVNFFLCGSLHGGTGACGVPVLGRFLNQLKQANPSWGWRIGAGLLAPYCTPPQPPFKALPEGAVVDAKVISDYVQAYGETPIFIGLNALKKRELVRQILLGFYADPEDMEARAKQGLSYYQDHSTEFFDELYLVGKPQPDSLIDRVPWSNGGSGQSNPQNSAEVVGALAALNFFSSTDGSLQQSYLLGSSSADMDSGKVRLSDLPCYTTRQKEEINPEAVFLATALARHWLLHQIRWEVPAKGWPDNLKGLRRIYESDPSRQHPDHLQYLQAADLLFNCCLSLLHPSESLGWHPEEAASVGRLLAQDEAAVKEISRRLARKMFSKSATDSVVLGQSSIKVSTFDIGEWCPKGDRFGRGEYMRHIWSELFARVQQTP